MTLARNFPLDSIVDEGEEDDTRINERRVPPKQNEERQREPSAGQDQGLAHIFHPPICPNSVFNPILHKPVIFNILLNRPHSFSTVYYTKDFGNLKLTYYILYRPDASKLDRIIKTLGEAYDDKFLPLIGNEGSEILKKILRDIDIQQLPMKCSRSNVSDYLLISLKSHASEFDIIIKDVQIINVTYSYQFDRCVHESNDDDNKKD
ncbi:hypothetical protein MRB53_026921 [Persea americana]|uniref:Uncharacterized protein n=1 Tax=Persea americana TaxID=3435 RepID=A0ACC2LJE8_PERAE|nr:hypothetical protein MRB53_026921 [Persea americana]